MEGDILLLKNESANSFVPVLDVRISLLISRYVAIKARGC